jgi:hypothetical protein
VRTLVKFVASLLVIAVFGCAVAWIQAGREPGPTVEFRQPDKFVGQSSELDLMVQSPEGRLSRLDVTVEQAGKSYSVLTIDQPTAATQPAAADRFYVMRPIGKSAIPELKAGPARIVVHAARPVLRGLRQVTSDFSHDVQVRLEAPQASVVSTFHYVNLGGAEFVVYRATPADVESGVRVGDRTYPGFPGTAVGIKDPAMHVAFFALSYDQDVNAPISVFATDPAGNTAVAAVDHMAFPKTFSHSTIPIDSWVGRVVPPIIANTPDMKLSSAPDDLVKSFVIINGELRRRNADTIIALAKKTAPVMLWNDSFTCRSSRRSAASSSTRRTSASTATASSSITAWACKRSTGTCRPSA